MKRINIKDLFGKTIYLKSKDRNSNKDALGVVRTDTKKRPQVATQYFSERIFSARFSQSSVMETFG